VERSSAVRYTYQDLLSLPESPTRRHEILDGKLYVTAAPRVSHQRVVLNLGAMMHALAREHRLGEVFVGPVTVHVHDEMVFEPDLVFVGSDRMWIVDPEGDIHGVPDLVVEVLSPSTRSYDRNLKRKHYMDSGLPQLWLVDIQQRAVEVWRSGVEEPDVERDAVRWQVGSGSFPLPLEEMLAGI
jgi:Uma2 family endonuclease